MLPTSNQAIPEVFPFSYYVELSYSSSCLSVYAETQVMVADSLTMASSELIAFAYFHLFGFCSFPQDIRTSAHHNKLVETKNEEKILK